MMLIDVPFSIRIRVASRRVPPPRELDRQEICGLMSRGEKLQGIEEKQGRVEHKRREEEQRAAFVKRADLDPNLGLNCAELGPVGSNLGPT